MTEGKRNKPEAQRDETVVLKAMQKKNPNKPKLSLFSYIVRKICNFDAQKRNVLVCCTNIELNAAKIKNPKQLRQHSMMLRYLFIEI